MKEWADTGRILAVLLAIVLVAVLVGRLVPIEEGSDVVHVQGRACLVVLQVCL